MFVYVKKIKFGRDIDYECNNEKVIWFNWIVYSILVSVVSKFCFGFLVFLLMVVLIFCEYFENKVFIIYRFYCFFKFDVD